LRFYNDGARYEFLIALRTFSVVFWDFIALGAFCAILVLGLSYFPVAPIMTSFHLWSLYVALVVAAFGLLKTSALLIQYYINRAHYMNYLKRSTDHIAQGVTCDQINK
jgi:hypothetical protein